MIEFIQAHEARYLPDIRSLFSEYQQAVGFSLCFQGFAEELEHLPGRYAPPSGRLILAQVDGKAAGCVALRPFTVETGEMKRLYVKPQFRALGLGRALVVRIISEARSVGYQRLWLDTLPTMQTAQKLYRKLGFRDIPPFGSHSLGEVRYLGLDL